MIVERNGKSLIPPVWAVCVCTCVCVYISTDINVSLKGSVLCHVHTYVHTHTHTQFSPWNQFGSEEAGVSDLERVM